MNIERIPRVPVDSKWLKSVTELTYNGKISYKIYYEKPDTPINGEWWAYKEGNLYYLRKRYEYDDYE